MGFNYAKERMKFDARWNRLNQEYRDAGMSEEAIRMMYEYDLDVFRKRRRDEVREQPLPSYEFGEDGKEHRIDLFAKFEDLTVSFDENDFHGRYDWIENLEYPALTYRLRKLKKSDLELLTLFAIEGYSQTEIAQLQGCSQKNISIKITRIKKYLKNF